MSTAHTGTSLRKKYLYSLPLLDKVICIYFLRQVSLIAHGNIHTKNYDQLDRT